VVPYNFDPVFGALPGSQISSKVPNTLCKPTSAVLQSYPLSWATIPTHTPKENF
jgi:hypothetical protein